MLLALVRWETRFLLPHHPLAFKALVLILFFCGVAANATVSPSASATVFCYVSGDGILQSCLDQDRLSLFLRGVFNLCNMDVNRTVTSPAAAP